MDSFQSHSCLAPPARLSGSPAPAAHARVGGEQRRERSALPFSNAYYSAAQRVKEPQPPPGRFKRVLWSLQESALVASRERSGRSKRALWSLQESAREAQLSRPACPPLCTRANTRANTRATHTRANTQGAQPIGHQLHMRPPQHMNQTGGGTLFLAGHDGGSTINLTFVSSPSLPPLRLRSPPLPPAPVLKSVHTSPHHPTLLPC